MINQNKLIIKHLDGFGGKNVDSVYLGEAYETGKPHVMEGMTMRIFSSKSRFFSSKLVLGMTGGRANGTKEIDNEIYRWKLQGAEEKFARIVENLESANSTAGINHTEFRIKLDLDYFDAPDVLFGEDNEYPLEITQPGIPDGQGTIYTVRIQGDNPNIFYPAYLMEPGREYNKVWTTVASEANDEFGTQQFPNAFELENQLGAFAQSYHVTDKAWRDEGKLEVQFSYTDKDGKEKMASRFLPMAEAKMWDELYKSMEAQMVYGKKQTRPAKSGYWKKTGAGLREQLKDSWVRYTNSPITVNSLQEYLMDIYFTRKDADQRETTAVTGTLGSVNFHNALVAIANGFLTVDTHWIRSSEGRGATPGLAYGAQFTRYTGPEGIAIKLGLNAMYDDRTYCKRMHPQYPNFPIDSARYTFLDFENNGGDNNIMMLKIKDTFRWGYRAGTHTPTGPVKGGSVVALKAGYDMFCEGTAGLWVKDVSRCGEYILDFEY